MRMRLLPILLLIAAAGWQMPRPAVAQDTPPPPDDDLRPFAVNVVKTPPFEKQFNGDGVYLGGGVVLTAAHVVGRCPLLTHPRVLIAGLDLPVTVVKKGSVDDVDLALLSIDESALPAGLQLRRNPLCKALPPPGANVLVVYPDRSVATHMLSPIYIPPRMRKRFYSLIDEQEGSGAGVFDAERRCLLGIISQKIRKYNYQRRNGRLVISDGGWAGYFVPVPAIANFLPAKFRF